MAATLITGATGFIGTRLARHLAERGVEVRAIYRPGAITAPLAHNRIHLVAGDVRDGGSVRRAMAGCDRVFHLAGYARNWASDKRTFRETNVGGLRNVLDAARALAVRKVVFTSSALTLGPSAGRPVDELTSRVVPPFSEYERSKIAAEELAQQYAHGGTCVTIVNPTRVFGPGLLSEANSATRLVQLYLAGRWRVMPGAGGQIGNWAFVDDVVQGHLLAMAAGKAGERYVLGGENASLKDVFRLTSDISGKRSHLFRLPFPIAMTVALLEQLRATVSAHYPLITPGWTRSFYENWACSSAKAGRELGYRITPLRESLRMTIDWLLREQEVTPCATP